MEGTNSNSKSWLIAVLVLATLLGLGGGVVGQLVSQSYIMESYFGIPGVSEINFPKDSRSSLVISGPKKVVVEQNDKVYETAQSVKTSLAGIYPKKTPNAQAGVMDGYYQPKELAGQALVISSDGWLVTDFRPEGEEWGKYVIAASNKELFQSDKQIFDSVSGLTFVHVPAKNLSVRSFADPSNLQSGQIVLSVNWLGVNQVNMVADVRKSAEAVSLTDKFSEEISLVDSTIKEAASPIVFNLAGEIVGFVNGQGRIMPAAQFRSVISSVLLKGKVERPSLGLAYVNLSKLVPEKPKNAGQQPSQGAIVVKSQGETERKIGLKEGDIITQVGAIMISDSMPLNEALQTFKVGDKINLVFWRDGKQDEIAVKANLLK
ncbi:serine protease [Candidatus Falkowbacteria bacterium]|nr:serine protease [Candidatus Falkowbacteria bacterium]